VETPRPKEIIGPGGPVARRLEGYEERAQQQDMAAHVTACLEGRRHILVEAGTGVGKSFGYLVPAMHHAHTTGERVLVSTRTIALQDQIDRKDLPLLAAVLPFEVPAVVAKGRNNYLCRRRLERAILLAADLFDEADARGRLMELKRWAEETAEGTKSDLPYTPEPALWEQVMAEAGNCSQRKCPHYAECFYQHARRRMEGSRIVVVNHALYFSDLALRIAGAAYLPDHAVAFFDEAHRVDEVATRQLGCELGPGRVEHLLSRLHSRRTAKGLLTALDLAGPKAAVAAAREAAREFFAAVGGWRKEQGRPEEDLLLGDSPFVANTLSGALSRLSSSLLQAADREALAEEDRMEVGQYAQRAAALARAAEILVDERPQEFVIWVEGRGPKLKLVGVPLNVGDLLAKHLYPARRCCLFTSATLATGEGPRGFDYIRDRLGLEKCDTVQLGSPFPFDRNVEIHLHRDLPDPQAGAPYEEALLARVKEELLAEGGRGLVLFTSWKLLERAKELAGELGAAGISPIFQGEGPVQRLVERKRRSPESALFGVESLWEGIDIPGDALTLVIITKLPFPVPGSPLVAARSRELEREGKRPFTHYFLPEAILRLKQGFGRLVRRGDDRGRVVLLDRRLLTRPYGRLFLRALPRCPLVIHEGEGETRRVEVEE